jgi:hypothetical protein
MNVDIVDDELPPGFVVARLDRLVDVIVAWKPQHQGSVEHVVSRDPQARWKLDAAYDVQRSSALWAGQRRPPLAALPHDFGLVTIEGICTPANDSPVECARPLLGIETRGWPKENNQNEQHNADSHKDQPQASVERGPRWSASHSACSGTVSPVQREMSPAAPRSHRPTHQTLDRRTPSRQRGSCISGPFSSRFRRFCHRWPPCLRVTLPAGSRAAHFRAGATRVPKSTIQNGRSCVLRPAGVGRADRVI